jgi:DNA-binding transcriptional ArsR family regulator
MPYTDDFQKQSEFLSIIGNVKRMQILFAIRHKEMAVGDLADRVEISQSALSQHLARLRSAGLVSTRRCSQTIYYQLGSAAAENILAALEQFGFSPQR